MEPCENDQSVDDLLSTLAESSNLGVGRIVHRIAVFRNATARIRDKSGTASVSGVPLNDDVSLYAAVTVRIGKKPGIPVVVEFYCSSADVQQIFRRLIRRRRTVERGKTNANIVAPNFYIANEIASRRSDCFHRLVKIFKRSKKFDSILFTRLSFDLNVKRSSFSVERNCFKNKSVRRVEIASIYCLGESKNEPAKGIVANIFDFFNNRRLNNRRLKYSFCGSS